MNHSKLSFFLGLAIACSVSSVNAADSRTALIIGLSTFSSSSIPELKGVPYDIQSAKTIALKMGIPESNIRVLRDAQATKANILKELRSLGDATDEGARSFVYFSGHGTRYNDEAAGGCVEGLLSYDQLAITNQEFAEATQKLAGKADKSIVMIDACHSQGVVPPKTSSRSMGSERFTAKFFLDAKSGLNSCSQPANQRTRSLLGEATKMGAIEENFIQITSSRANEVSFDEPGKGGIATQALRDCMLGDAKDLNKSGAVSLNEIQQCAQESVNKKLKNVEGVSPHHITISGTRNLIPVLNQPAVVVASNTSVSSPSMVASLATLKDIESQSNPKRSVDIKLNKSTLKIGRDALDIAIKSSHDGYVQIVLVGSDAKSFYVLFPNGLDRDNRVRAGQTIRIPSNGWQIKSAGPEGTSHLLVLVTDAPRKLETLRLEEPTAAEPFTFSLNDINGRSALLDFLIGKGVNGRSESFGAKILSIKETL